jgi:hypothetical protein
MLYKVDQRGERLEEARREVAILWPNVPAVAPSRQRLATPG